MAKSYNFKELKLDRQIDQLIALAEKQRKEKEEIEAEKLLSIQFGDLEYFINGDIKFTDECRSFVENRILGFGWEEVKPNNTDHDATLKKLLMLLARIKTASLGRILIDFKSMFRTKVPLLFKNLDDAHITHQILNILNFEISYIPHNNSQWKKKTYIGQ